MKHHSLYLDWYIHVPRVKYDLRSSGIAYFKYDLNLGEVDLSVNYTPRTAQLLAERYGVKPENVLVSSEGASGQNSRIIRLIAERNGKKNEAIVEYPTYEPLLRQVQEHFPRVKRLERREEESYGLNADALRKSVSEKTGVLVVTNPHAPSGAIANVNELREVMAVAHEYGFYVMCDEIYAEFERQAIPTVFSVDGEMGIVTTSFTKAYGLGGLRLGVALAQQSLVEELFNDVVDHIGGPSNLVQLAAVELLTRGKAKLERHKQKWTVLKRQTEEWMNARGIEFSPNKAGITYWVKLSIEDTHKWVNEHAIPKRSVAVVPGAFFLFKDGNEIVKSSNVRLGLGNINPEQPNLGDAFEAFEKAVGTYQK